ncbi:hypothetical protein SCHIN_v1c05320 [Spiroplasma chinense]|uniref:ECF transporter S component n=1 Tax=Spiroplasma chinense TaxID=216932 RepID=A0A5B9Y4W7_9MOLU|nr:hypothetical protein [Spiroplasma chinense]QEH61729.1 hypothetical protein SCHIN_v1c05320 [Spiroplasma chinense]
MKKTDEFSNVENYASIKPCELNNIDLDYEISKLSKTSRRLKLRTETLNITMVSLLLSMSTAVGLLTVIIPLGITSINVGFVFKYYVIAISFQVVGVYWGMIIGLLDGFLQFIIFGGDPLFRVTSSLGLMAWVFLFWLFFDKVFRIYSKDESLSRMMAAVAGGFVVLLLQPLISAILAYFRSLVVSGSAGYSAFTFFNTWIALGVFDLFAVILFVLTTYRIQLIAAKYKS